MLELRPSRALTSAWIETWLALGSHCCWEVALSRARGLKRVPRPGRPARALSRSHERVD